jgi:SAM-dependent methyltransferase
LTQELANLSDSVTVLDSSPEAVAIAKKKVVGNVSWRIGDIFRYRPDRAYDTVFFGFWLSHVPVERFEGFWQLVADCMSPSGRVFFIDNAHPALAQAVAPDLFSAERWSVDETRVGGIDSVTDLDTGVASRLAADGSTYKLVKIWWQPEQLRSRLGEMGWSMQIRTTEWAFIYGFGSRAKPSSCASQA